MHRPIKLTASGATAITLHRLHRELANELTAHGEYFFKASDLLDAFGLAHTPVETRDAIAGLLSMTKELKALDCQLINIGFRELDRATLKFAFTYSVRSMAHENAPLLINECFSLQVPLLALASETAGIWAHAFESRPVNDIMDIAKGL